MLSEAKALFCFQAAYTAHFLDECFISTIFEERRATQTCYPFCQWQAIKVQGFVFLREVDGGSSGICGIPLIDKECARSCFPEYLRTSNS